MLARASGRPPDEWVSREGSARYRPRVPDHVVTRQGLSARQCVRALIVGLLITGVSGAAHGTHGHHPSPVLLMVTALLVAAVCMPFCRSRLKLPGALALLAVGELALHAWLAWFDLPVLGTPTTTTAHLMHGDHITATLSPRDFSVLIPEPSMVIVHALAAGVLAVIIVHADGLAHHARSLLSVLLMAVTPHVVMPARRRVMVCWSLRVLPAECVFAHDVRRRGPPAVACATA